MIRDKVIFVNGKKVYLKPYSEKRLKQLVEVQAEIDAFIESNPQATFADIDTKERAKWWKKKADILWETDEPLKEEFFASEEFESSLLKDSEDFFLSYRVYL